MGKYRSTRTANFALAAATSIIAMVFGTCEIAVAAPLTLKDTKVTGCKKFVISDNNKNWKAMGFMVVQGRLQRKEDYPRQDDQRSLGAAWEWKDVPF